MFINSLSNSPYFNSHKNLEKNVSMKNIRIVKISYEVTKWETKRTFWKTELVISAAKYPDNHNSKIHKGEDSCRSKVDAEENQARWVTTGGEDNHEANIRISNQRATTRAFECYPCLPRQSENHSQRCPWWEAVRISTRY